MNIALLSLAILSGCSSIPLKYRGYETSYFNSYGNSYGNISSVGYDFNNDKIEDFRYYYRVNKIDSHTAKLKLIAIQKDKNKNGKFENSEFIWSKRLEMEELVGEQKLGVEELVGR